MNIPNAEKLLEYIDLTRGIDKLHFDYFKNLTILGSSAILIVFVLYEKIGAKLFCWQKAMLVLSLLLFFTLIWFSLNAMQHAGNATGILNAMQIKIKDDDEDETKILLSKREATQTSIGNIDKVTKCLYLAGIGIILFLSAFLLIS